ncbi:MAG: polysaccharide deacetylase family protein [Bacteroidetes bacterium]|nr:polysaccharide deacetylase family protein [Bacteroidota bacterium]
MKWYWIKTSRLVKWLFPKYIWNLPTHEKIVYLTFDDGPMPEITPWVLDQLDAYQVKATFFCIGDNVRKHPEIYTEIIRRGHATGNHTFNHLNGWKTATSTYIENTIKWEDYAATQSFLFRPPYGKIKRSQAQKLMQKGYKIIMWDVLSADFDASVAPEKCLSNVVNHLESGSIVVFHDSLKAFKNIQYALPKTLQFLKENGFVGVRID